jgi:hypothetical protein
MPTRALGNVKSFVGVSSHPGLPLQVPGEVPSQVGSMIGPPQDAHIMYNPYAGLQHTHPRANRSFRVAQQPEFVFQEEAAVRRRGFGENLGFYTGTGYLGGAVAGGAVGLAQATVLQPLAAVPPLQQTRRLMLNRLLNSAGQTGRLVGVLLVDLFRVTGPAKSRRPEGSEVSRTPAHRYGAWQAGPLAYVGPSNELR